MTDTAAQHACMSAQVNQQAEFVIVHIVSSLFQCHQLYSEHRLQTQQHNCRAEEVTAHSAHAMRYTLQNCAFFNLNHMWQHCANTVMITFKRAFLLRKPAVLKVLVALPDRHMGRASIICSKGAPMADGSAVLMLGSAIHRGSETAVACEQHCHSVDAADATCCLIFCPHVWQLVRHSGVALLFTLWLQYTTL